MFRGGEPGSRRAFVEAGKADLLITVGTSLQVYPAAGIPDETSRHGGKVAIINNQPTPLDREVDLVVRGAAGQILSAVVDRLARPEKELGEKE